MIEFSLSELAEITNGILLGENIKINKISTDTRKENFNTLFIALKGNRFDAHNFIEEAIFKGIIALMIEHNVVYNIPTIIVKNTKIALGILGNLIRKKSKVKTLAITGSSGKTTVKEMTHKILSLKNTTLCNYKNFNNDIGVPLTLIQLNKKHKYLIIELGSNKIGEISYLTKIVEPYSALINNIYPSHLLGFYSLKNIAIEKGKIFNNLINNGYAIINYDNNYLFYWNKRLKNKNFIFYSTKFKNKINIWASNIITNITHISFDINFSFSKKINIKMPLLGLHNVANALAATALSLSVKTSINHIKEGLCSMKAIPGRMYPIKIGKHKCIIDDTYNANFGSILFAINFLKNIPGYLIFVIGEIYELGNKANFYLKKIGEISNNMKINKIISFGINNKIITTNLNIGEHFINKEDLINRLTFFLYKYKKITILIKGSRMSYMDEIVNLLKEKFYDDIIK